MAPFIYAIPQVTAVSSGLVKRIGLDEVLQDTDPSQHKFRQIGKGPEGQAGVLFMVTENTKLLHYKPDEQTWDKSRNGKYWIGFYNKDKPTELILRRPRQLAGHDVELQDGSKWLIPIARIITGVSTLPQSLFIDSQDEITTRPLQQYTAFTDRVDELWDDFRAEIDPKSGKEPNLSTADRMHLAAEALSWNYHVSLNEINMLGLITTQNLIEIMSAIIDVTTLIEEAKHSAKQKKNEKSSTAGAG